ncbi:MAG: MFS transporter, partial [Bacillota bacterium]
LGITTLRFQYYSGIVGFAALLIFFLVLFAMKKPAAPVGPSQASSH